MDNLDQCIDATDQSLEFEWSMVRKFNQIMERESEGEDEEEGGIQLPVPI
jgi:hypothetical protein